MLLALSLQDFVLVEKLDLDFQGGFTVLTGETGAGKSVTLDAVGLLLGDKADYAQVRTGAKEARLSALFDLSALPDLAAELRDQGLLDEDAAELSLRRIIDAKGRSRSFINNQTATLAQLKHIGEQLIDIHGQNAHHSLNQEAAQRHLLDAFSGSLKTADEVRQHYRLWQQALQALEQAQTQSEHIALERERLEWQFGELDKLGAAEETAREYIDGEDGAASLLYRCRRELENLAAIEPRFAESIELIVSAEAELEEVSANLRSVGGSVEINPQELALQEERMRELMSAARKYRVEPAELPAKLAEIQAALNDLDAAADTEALRQNAERCEAAYHEAAQRLSAQRRQGAAKLADETCAHLQKLAMKGARFHIELLPSAPGAHGLEQVQYQVAANKGNPLRPLNKAASGGELARISLSLQVAASRYTQVPTLIFDEVDTGVGGGVAETVGRALRSLGARHQVLAVTHLPQVAACGEQHWQVSKHGKGGQTVSEIRVLEGDARTAEIARMLGGETITDTTRAHAAEMLAMAARD